MAEGIEVRHAKDCPKAPGGSGARCNCQPSYRASVWSNRERKRIRKTFPTPAAAKAWRQDALRGLRTGTLRAPKPTTVEQAAEDWLAGAKDGSIRTRGGARYKPSAIRDYEINLRARVIPALGRRRLTDVGRLELQDYVDRLVAEGRGAATIRNTIMPLRTIYRRAVARGDLTVNPTAGLEVPAVENRRDRIADPMEAAALIAAVQPRDRALWATAMYAGLRRGELQGLRWDDVDLAAGVLRVRRGWDPEKGEIDTKSRMGRRTVPLTAILRDVLVEHRMDRGADDPHALVFGRTPHTPFDPNTVYQRTRKLWKAAGLTPISFHECRHTFASMMIAAGVNAKALCTYIGHANISETFDRYGHLMPGNEDEAAGLLEAYLQRANTAARTAQIAGVVPPVVP